MRSDQPLPREVKAFDTALLLGLNQRLDPAWVMANAAYEGNHYLWPARWNSLFRRPDVPRRLRCELLLLTPRTGERVMSLLDVLSDAFAPLPRVTSCEEGIQVSRLLDRVPTVREWLLWEGEGSPGRL
ncbi:hypothetical protein ACWDZ4_06435 [Streptomyces sp. NPDC003016]